MRSAITALLFGSPKALSKASLTSSGTLKLTVAIGRSIVEIFNNHNTPFGRRIPMRLIFTAPVSQCALWQGPRQLKADRPLAHQGRGSLAAPRKPSLLYAGISWDRPMVRGRSIQYSGKL